jgi:2-polyprenyl-3-methyl-5-hydroxy-6-metoxy-1,4-benzoquinol methylase
MRKRLSLALTMLTAPTYKKVERILDVGYGGGTFIPTLSRLATQVYGIDLHDKMHVVNKILRKEKVKAALSKDSIFRTKFPANFFDRIVCLSVMEHFKGKELDQACREMKRILVPDGFAVLGFPTKNIISNFIIENILKFKPDEIHPSGHTQILETVRKNFSTSRVTVYPPFLPMNLALYVVVKAVKTSNNAVST